MKELCCVLRRCLPFHRLLHPIYFDTTEIVPAPNLVPMLIIKNSRGITKLTAASWSAPSPATQN